MTNYAETVSKHRRLTILKFLSDSPSYTSNASILEGVCNSFGMITTRDQVDGEISWLAENGLVLRTDEGGFIVATATTRGVDVASGKSRHDGVRRPAPGA
jgi:hypothetical protein